MLWQVTMALRRPERDLARGPSVRSLPLPRRPIFDNDCEQVVCQDVFSAHAKESSDEDQGYEAIVDRPAPEALLARILGELRACR
jgi:hypothetical protein